MGRNRLLRGGVTVVVVAVVAYFFWRGLAGNWEAVRQIDVRVNAATLASVLLFALAVVLTGLLWGRMVNRLGTVRVGRLEAVRVQCASWLLKYVPGQVGSVANKIVWAKDRGVSRTLVVITFVYENVFLLLGSIVPAVVILLAANALDATDEVALPRRAGPHGVAVGRLGRGAGGVDLDPRGLESHGHVDGFVGAVEHRAADDGGRAVAHAGDRLQDRRQLAVLLALGLGAPRSRPCRSTALSDGERGCHEDRRGDDDGHHRGEPTHRRSVDSARRGHQRKRTGAVGEPSSASR